jgi:hypothetical protein
MSQLDHFNRGEPSGASRHVRSDQNVATPRLVAWRGEGGAEKASLLVFFQHPLWKDELSLRPFARFHYGSGEEQTGGLPRIDCSVRVHRSEKTPCAMCGRVGESATHAMRDTGQWNKTEDVAIVFGRRNRCKTTGVVCVLYAALCRR